MKHKSALPVETVQFNAVFLLLFFTSIQGGFQVHKKWREVLIGLRVPIYDLCLIQTLWEAEGIKI